MSWWVSFWAEPTPAVAEATACGCSVIFAQMWYRMPLSEAAAMQCEPHHALSDFRGRQTKVFPAVCMGCMTRTPCMHDVRGDNWCTTNKHHTTTFFFSFFSQNRKRDIYALIKEIKSPTWSAPSSGLTCRDASCGDWSSSSPPRTSWNCWEKPTFTTPPYGLTSCGDDCKFHDHEHEPRRSSYLFISLSATEIRKCCLFETAQGHFYRGQATIYCLHLIPWFYFTLLVGLMQRKIWLWCHCFYGDKKNGQGQWGCSVWCIIIWHNTKKSLTQGVIDRSRKLTGCRTFFDLNLLLGPWKLRIT